MLSRPQIPAIFPECSSAGDSDEAMAASHRVTRGPSLFLQLVPQLLTSHKAHHPCYWASPAARCLWTCSVEAQLSPTLCLCHTSFSPQPPKVGSAAKGRLGVRELEKWEDSASVPNSMLVTFCGCLSAESNSWPYDSVWHQHVTGWAQRIGDWPKITVLMSDSSRPAMW